jgi:pimeloyl-ACP methyl ester carboxylesterase
MKRCFLIVYLLLLSIWCISQKLTVSENKFLFIGGIEQWVTINGEDLAKPVILFLHGGPGSVMSPYVDTIFKVWQKEFILVHWDQRGAGRTFGKNAPGNVDEDYWIENPLSIQKMTSDAIELSEYLLNYLKKKKIIIIATSWGSVLGAKMVLQRPDLYYAYIAHSQVVKSFDAKTYDHVMEMARTSKDVASIDVLTSIGMPPYDDAKNSGKFLKVIKKYEKANSVPAPDTWWQLRPEYDNSIDDKHREEGDDYSFINYVGHKKLGIKAMMSEIDFIKDILEYKVPVYFIQGENDILTPQKATKDYFDKITAPVKEFHIIPGAAHGFNQAVVDAQYYVLKKLILK